MVFLGDVIILGHVVDRFNYGRKVCRPIKIHILKGVLVCGNDTFQAIDLRVKDVAVEGEAVAGAVRRRWHSGTEAKDRNSLVRVVVLEDIAN